jgi:hypothetical protein
MTLQALSGSWATTSPVWRLNAGLAEFGDVNAPRYRIGVRALRQA